MPLDPVELRRTIHQNPELMFEEFLTTQLLIDNISKLGVDGFREILKCSELETAESMAHRA
jgi:metal-dependent amidase/aminoacylase/carboxypeptidase family protein